MSISQKTYKDEKTLKLLSDIYQLELEALNRYLHYSFMIMGYNRIPIQKWFRSNAQEAMDHAVNIGEKITSLGGHPPIFTPRVDESNLHSIGQLLEESLKVEEEGIALYKQLVDVATEFGDVALEELARECVRTEVEHADEVRKMMRKPE